MLRVRRLKTSRLSVIAREDPQDVILVMPSIDMSLAMRAADVMARRTRQDALLVVAEDDLRLGFIMTANLVFAKTRSDYFGYVAQDAFAGEFWLDYGLDSLKRSSQGLLAFNDGRFFGKTAVFGLAKRAWLQEVYRNVLFYPEYTSHFADLELSVLALQTSNMVFNPHALLMEVDYEKHLHGNNPDDAALYRRRAESGFDGRISPFTPA